MVLGIKFLVEEVLGNTGITGWGGGGGGESQNVLVALRVCHLCTSYACGIAPVINAPSLS